MHVSPQARSLLPQLMSSGARVPVEHAKQGQALELGHVYVAPPDHHLTLRYKRMQLGRGPRENGHRPAVDPLFRSAARWFKERAIGVVLTGSLDDGTAGLLAIKHAGGVAVVQDPQDALSPDMPKSAIENVDVDYISKLDELGDLLLRLVSEPPTGSAGGSVSKLDELGEETEIADIGSGGQTPAQLAHAIPSVFACPDCAGVLWELKEGTLVRYRCRVGHGYMPEALQAAQSNKIEEALWTALRALRDNVDLSMRLAARARSMSLPDLEAVYAERATEAEQRAELLETMLQRGEVAAGDHVARH